MVARSTPKVRATFATASSALMRSMASRCAVSFFGRPYPSRLGALSALPRAGSDQRTLELGKAALVRC